ncbi:MAG: SAM-dependent methyltransferase [Acidobacteriota bacterium]
MNPIVSEVARRGSVSFSEFMGLALYHPTAGYYTRARRGGGPVGPEGDFVTAPTASNLFARTVARLLDQLAQELGEPLTLAELGAGEGALLRRLVPECGGIGGETLARVVAVEASERARKRLVATCPGVESGDTLVGFALPSGPTVLLASELYDAVPARRATLRRRDGVLEMAEYHVAVAPGGRLAWRLAAPADGAVEKYLAVRGLQLEEGQIVEIRPGLEAMHAEHLAWCGRSALAVIIEYGYPARQLFNPRARRLGTLVGTFRHRIVANPLSRPGQVDLTAHVNFDDLDGAAARLGWERAQIKPLGSFLALHGALGMLPQPVAEGARLSAADWAELSAAKRLLHPSGMGGDLKALVQGRGAAWSAYEKVATPPPTEA